MKMTGKPSLVPRGYVAIFAMLVSCFALWGVLNNMTDNLVPAFHTDMVFLMSFPFLIYRPYFAFISLMF